MTPRIPLMHRCAAIVDVASATGKILITFYKPELDEAHDPASQAVKLAAPITVL
jgi:hypothetical protein